MANGGASSPTKYGLNGTIPATLNSTVGSCGIRLADGTARVAARGEEVDERLAELVGGARRVVMPIGPGEPTGGGVRSALG